MFVNLKSDGGMRGKVKITKTLTSLPMMTNTVQIEFLVSFQGTEKYIIFKGSAWFIKHRTCCYQDFYCVFSVLFC